MKHFIRMNIASSVNYYWDRNAQNWTSDHTHATLFNSDQEACLEAAHAEQHTEAEVLVCVAAKVPT